MILRSLNLRDFRNHQELDLEFTEKFTVITGPNGIGKTSILESIALLGSGRSFRLARNKDFLRFGSEKSQIKSKIFHSGLNSEIKIEIGENSKKIEVNEKALRKLRNLREMLPFVVFAPIDHRIIDGDASDRRHFLDLFISALDFDYADLIQDYRRNLQQRNRILKNAKEARSFNQLKDQLVVWDQILVELGAKIVVLRKKYIDLLNKEAANQFFNIAPNKKTFQITYDALNQNQAEFLDYDIETIKEIITKSLDNSLHIDALSGTTQVGPHKDDLSFNLGTKDTKLYGSQGEKKTAVLAIRLAELALLSQIRNCSPILLVDDISSELDLERREALLKLLRQENLQVLLTATEVPANLVDASARSYRHLSLG